DSLGKTHLMYTGFLRICGNQASFRVLRQGCTSLFYLPLKRHSGTLLERRSACRYINCLVANSEIKYVCIAIRRFTSKIYQHRKILRTQLPKLKKWVSQRLNLILIKEMIPINTISITGQLVLKSYNVWSIR